MLKVAHINKVRLEAEAGLSDYRKKLEERQRKAAYKMLFQEGIKKDKKSLNKS